MIVKKDYINNQVMIDPLKKTKLKSTQVKCIFANFNATENCKKLLKQY